jgi:hypothetical protein
MIGAIGIRALRAIEVCLALSQNKLHNKNHTAYEGVRKTKGRSARVSTTQQSELLD